MGHKTFDSNNLNITHAEMLQMVKEGSLILGINDNISAGILNGDGFKTTRWNLPYFNFIKWISFGILGCSIYLSIASNWWWIVVGFFVAVIIWGANKRGGSENLIDAAMIDCEFYERVKELGGWIYQVDESAIKEKE